MRHQIHNVRVISEFGDKTVNLFQDTGGNNDNFKAKFF